MAPRSLLIPTQGVIVEPVPLIRPIPFPFDVPPTEISPFIGNPISPFEEEPPLTNPFPDNPECAEEWATAMAFCFRLWQKKVFKPGYDGFGADFEKCVKGQVSEACGGNPTA